MIKPTWFDEKYSEVMANMDAEACLSLMASDPKIIASVKGAFSQVKAIQTGRFYVQCSGPNKTQALRIAICEALK